MTQSNSKTNNQSNVSSLKLLVTLMIGIVIGFTFAQVMDTSRYEIPSISTSMRNPEYWSHLQTSASEELIDEEHVVADISQVIPNNTDTNVFNTDDLNTTIADQLYGKVKILCWILTGPMNHAKKAVHVKNTWGKRCNKLIFMSSQEDKELGAIKLPAGEGRGNLWNKTREAFKYIYDHHVDEYDWFVKADDDT